SASGIISSTAVASMKPAPSAIKYFRYLRDHCRRAISAPPATFAAAAVSPSSTPTSTRIVPLEIIAEEKLQTLVSLAPVRAVLGPKLGGGHNGNDFKVHQVVPLTDPGSQQFWARRFHDLKTPAARRIDPA